MSVKGLKGNEYIVTTKQISEILSLSTRRIQQLANENALVKTGRGRFDLPASITSYINYLIDKERPDEELSKYEEEAKWVKARRQKTELELQIMKGELHRSEDVKRVLNNMLGGFRGKLLAIPSKTAPQLVGETEITPIKEKLKESIYEAMDELSEYDPNVFYDQSKDKIYLDDDLEGEVITDSHEE
jgi:phage terminase Nu1 subunit (DNA packaging protein)